MTTATTALRPTTKAATKDARLPCQSTHTATTNASTAWMRNRLACADAARRGLLVAAREPQVDDSSHGQGPRDDPAQHQRHEFVAQCAAG